VKEGGKIEEQERRVREYTYTGYIKVEN